MISLVPKQLEIRAVHFAGLQATYGVLDREIQLNKKNSQNPFLE